MSVKIRKRKNLDGSTSLLLDIYHNGERKQEFLKSLKLSKATTSADRQKNKENLELAFRIAAKKAQELTANDHDILSDTGKKTLVVEWMQSFIDEYDKKDVRNMQGALNRFIEYLKESKIEKLTFGRINELMVSDFQDYLKKKSIGEGASSYFARFKKMMKRAYRQKLMSRNVAADVPTIQGKARRKDTLTMDEIIKLSTTPTESDEVKRAFLFSLSTGLRWVDVKAITWNEKQGDVLIVKQKKTGEDLYINLNKTALKLLGPEKKPKDLIFDLPTANGANKTVKAWVKRAGIDKKITWHNARHSVGVNLAAGGEDLLTIAAVLGHTGIKHTLRYAKAAQELKQRATDKLNF